MFLSHDWPQGIEHHGDVRALLRRKPHFRDDVRKGVLGSPPLMNLLQTLKPAWWFAAHLHCRFEARFGHGPLEQAESVEQDESAAGENPDEITIEEGGGEAEGSGQPGLVSEPEPAISSAAKPAVAPANPDEIMLDDEFEEVAKPPTPPPPPLPQRETRFIALDKCLPRRQFLEVRVPVLSCIRTRVHGERHRTPCYISQIVDIPEPPDFHQEASGERIAPVLSFDPEWLAITRAFHPYMPTGPSQMTYPVEDAARAAVETEVAWVKDHVQSLKVDDCQAFVITAPPPGPSDNPSLRQQQRTSYVSISECHVHSANER